MAELHDIEVGQYLKDCVDISPEELEDEFIRLPADLAYWNHQYAETIKEAQRAKFLREQTFARLHTDLREEMMNEAREAVVKSLEEDSKSKMKAKAPTIADIESAVYTHAEYIAAKEREIQADGEKARLYGVVDAIRTKRDMIIQMGADRRAVMMGDPILREQTKAAQSSAL